MVTGFFFFSDRHTNNSENSCATARVAAYSVPTESEVKFYNEGAITMPGARGKRPYATEFNGCMLILSTVFVYFMKLF